MSTQASTFAYFGNKISSSTVATKASNTAASKTSAASGFSSASTTMSQASKATTGFSDVLSKVTSGAQVQIREGYQIPFGVTANPSSVPVGLFNVGHSESVEEVFDHMGLRV